VSEHSLIIIPFDPRLVPEKSHQLYALSRVHESFQAPANIKMQTFEMVRFFHCGENMERIACPQCDSNLTDFKSKPDWWGDRISDDYRDGGFLLNTYQTPCCGTPVTLNDLTYEFEMGFARFAIEVENAMGKVDESLHGDLESILNTRLRKIHQWM
jgi:hypothetical protein